MKNKKLFSLVLIALFVSANAFAYQDGGAIHTTNGSGGTVADPVRIYQMGRYPEIGANDPGLSAGDVVLMDAVSKDGVTINLSGRGTSVDSVIGVVVSPTIASADQAGTVFTDLGHRNWGYYQVYGTCATINVINSATVVAGGALVASGTARMATGVVTATPTAARTLGFAYTTSTGQAAGFVATN